jgi:hypothetical protein
MELEADDLGERNQHRRARVNENALPKLAHLGVSRMGDEELATEGSG